MAKHLPTLYQARPSISQQFACESQHLPTVCLRWPSICQRFAKRVQAFANALPSGAKHLWRPSICQGFACGGQAFANLPPVCLPMTAKDLPTVCL
jgi:hypothetical protein